MSTYLITGATSGLGRAVAQSLARMRGHRLVLPVRDASRSPLLREELLALGAADVTLPAMDLSSLASVAEFVKRFRLGASGPIDGLLLNAGRQSAGALVMSVDGIESTFAVNHLAHHLLLMGLQDQLSPQATVGWTASGTHDPEEKSARMSGFRGARYTTAEHLAQGRYDGASPDQACKDAYATSKLCNIVSARAFVGILGTGRRTFSFDPGLMPGTGLAREHGAAARWMWRHVLPRVAPLMPGTSSTARSSAILADLLVGRRQGSRNGAYFNYTGREIEPASPATEPWVAEDLLQGSDRLLARFV
jgi:NAD(P)-dependent dehydrogenase (short-subunit alcohol dehydrogenase family)